MHRLVLPNFNNITTYPQYFTCTCIRIVDILIGNIRLGLNIITFMCKSQKKII